MNPANRKTLTYTALSTFNACPRRYRNRFVRGLAPLERDEALRLGTVWHELLERRYKAVQTGAAPFKASDALEYLDARYPARAVDAEQRRQWHLLRAMYAEYDRRFGSETFDVIDVEREFEVPIVNPATGAESRSFVLRGKVDLVVHLKDTSELAIVEHKTTAGITGNYIERLPLDFQVHLYAATLSRLFKEPVRWVIYNAIEKSRLQQKAGETEAEFEARRAELAAKNKSGKSNAVRQMPESDDEYAARLSAWYAEPDSMHRELLLIAPGDIRETEGMVWEYTQSLLFAQRRDAWPKNTRECFGLSGKPCSYVPLCRSQDSPNIAENCYRIETPFGELQASPSPQAQDASSLQLTLA